MSSVLAEKESKMTYTEKKKIEKINLVQFKYMFVYN